MARKTVFIILFLFSCASHGAVYQWTDENGQVYFGNVPPKQQKKYLLGDEIKLKRKAAVPPTKKVSAKTGCLASGVQKKQKKASTKETTPMPTTKGGLKKSATKGQNAVGKPAPAKNKKKAGKQKNIKGSAVLNEVKEAATAKVPKTKLRAEKPAIAVGKKVKTHKKLKAGMAEKVGAKKERAETGKDPDKCGLFRGFVEEYTIKKNEGCPGSACELYKRQLEKYKKKAERYC